MRPLLEIKDLRIYFRLRNAVLRAVDGVSFSVNSGEMLGLVGESGSGKSVTALSVLGLVKPPGQILAGKIVFQGRNLLDLPERQMRRVRGQAISMVFQNPRSSLNPVLTVGHQLARVYRLHRQTSARQANERALELLKLVGIPDPDKVMKRYAHQLSGGMCQRIMIAMALICEPALVIADEPTTGLDVTVQWQILELMRDLRRKTGVAQMLITHDLGVVAETCDRVVVMYSGKVVEVGTVKQVFTQPLHPYTASLLASVPDVGEDFRATPIPGSVPDPRDPPAGCRFHPRCQYCFQRCRTEEPPMIQLVEGRSSACHLLSENAPAEARREFFTVQPDGEVAALW